jgi:hypothetical protein
LDTGQTSGPRWLLLTPLLPMALATVPMAMALVLTLAEEVYQEGETKNVQLQSKQRISR